MISNEWSPSCLTFVILLAEYLFPSSSGPVLTSSFIQCFSAYLSISIVCLHKHIWLHEILMSGQVHSCSQSLQRGAQLTSSLATGHDRNTDMLELESFWIGVSVQFDTCFGILFSQSCRDHEEYNMMHVIQSHLQERQTVNLMVSSDGAKSWKAWILTPDHKFAKIIRIKCGNTAKKVEDRLGFSDWFSDKFIIDFFGLPGLMSRSQATVGPRVCSKMCHMLWLPYSMLVAVWSKKRSRSLSPNFTVRFLRNSRRSLSRVDGDYRGVVMAFSDSLLPQIHKEESPVERPVFYQTFWTTSMVKGTTCRSLLDPGCPTAIWYGWARREMVRSNWRWLLFMSGFCWICRFLLDLHVFVGFVGVKAC